MHLKIQSHFLTINQIGMAKEDFCFTYYDGDAARDMQHMDRLCRGAYTDLVIMQRKTENCMLSIPHIKVVLGSDYEKCWPSLSFILKQDGDFFYIEWVKNSVKKMKENSKIQAEKIKEYWRKVEAGEIEPPKNGRTPKNTKLQKTNTTVLKTDTEKIPYINGNGNEYVIKEGNKSGFFLNEFDKDFQLSELDVGKTIEFIKLKTQKSLTGPEILNHWQAFKIDNFDKKEWYHDVSKLISHFRNSLKIHVQNNGTNTNHTSGSAKLGTSAARIEALKNW